MLEELEIKTFQNKIYLFYKKQARIFPWRDTTDPYRILISELMLQQTQAQRVIPKYSAFIKVFPNWQSLHKASFQDVLKLWSGLGYNRRAIYLKNAAGIIVTKYNGKTPKTVEELMSLPGIGFNTASAICAFAYNQPVVFIETNIRSVFINEFSPILNGWPDWRGSQNTRTHSSGSMIWDEGGTGPVYKYEVHDNDILPLIEQTLDTKDPRAWYWALLDYGNFLKKTLPNPSRLSQHYKKQSKFEGSDRQLRGKILKMLTNKGMVNIKDIALQLSKDVEKVKEISSELQKEGFIKKRSNTLSIS